MALALFLSVPILASTPVEAPDSANPSKRVVVTGLKAAGVATEVVEVMAGQIRSALFAPTCIRS